MTSHQRSVVELEVYGRVILRLMNYESDGSATNLNSCNVFFLRKDIQRK